MGSAKKKINLRWLCCIMALVFSLSLAGCSGGKKPHANGNESGDASGIANHASSQQMEETDPNWPVTVGEVFLVEEPLGVVSLSPATTELVCELGGVEKLAGVSDFCDFPLEVQSLPRCGSAATPNLERILQLQPVLVLSSVTLTSEARQTLSDAGIQVAVLPRAMDMVGIEENYTSLSTLLWGMEDGLATSTQVFGDLKEKYAALSAAAATVDTPYSGIWLRAIPLLMATGDSWENILMTQVLGVSNDAGEFDSWEYPSEKAVDLYPDMLFYDDSIDPAYFGTTQVYSTTDAYKQKRMYPFDAVVFERQTGRFVDELHRMLLQVYPELESQVGAAPERPEEVLALPPG